MIGSSCLPRRQMYFQFLKEPDPGTGHQLHAHGSFAEAARSQHPTEHRSHLHLLSGSTEHSKESHNTKIKLTKKLLASYLYAKDSFNFKKYYTINQSHKNNPILS